MWKLLRYQDKKYWAITITASLLTFFQIITDLFLPAILSAMIPLIAFGDQLGNDVIVRLLSWNFKFATSQEALTTLGIAMGTISVAGVIFGVLSNYLGAKSAVNLAKIIRFHLFSKIQELSSANLDKFGTSSLVTRLTNDVSLIQTMAFMTIRVMMRGPFLFVGGLIFSLLTNLSLSWSVAVLVPLLLIVIVISGMKAGPLFRKNQKVIDELNIQSRESLLGIRVIKSFNLEANQRAKFETSNKKWNLISTKAFVILSALQPIVIFIANFTTLVILLIGRYDPNAGIFNPDDLLGSRTGYTQLLSFLQYQVYIVMGITTSMMVLVNYIRSRASVMRVQEILNEKPSIPFVKSDINVEDGSIKFENVNFRYHSEGENVLKDINFEIQPGQIVGIIGPTGSGKTSLVNLISRIYETESGNVIVGKHEVKKIDTNNLHQAIGHVLQENILYKGTIKSNLLFGNEQANEAEIDEALDIACAKAFIEKLPDGINQPVEQRGKNLSGGQKQRVCIARTVLRKPKIIILDDSTSALDAITDKTLRANIKSKLSGVTTVIVAQKILSIKDADQIFVLEKGALVAKGKHDDLIKNCDLYQKIAESQMNQEEIANA